MQNLGKLLVELLAENKRGKEAVTKFLKAAGHDLCHENRRELAEAFGLSLPLVSPPCPMKMSLAGAASSTVTKSTAIPDPNPTRPPTSSIFKLWSVSSAP